MNLPRISIPSRPKAFRFDLPRVSDAVFEVKAEADAGTITIFDVIGYEVTASRIAGALRQIGNKPVTLLVNSPGGDYFEGVTIYNLLRGHGQPITAQVLGTAASAASVILMAADRIEIARNAEVMIHDPWMVAAGNADTMAEAERWLRQLSASCAETYAARTGQPLDDIKGMMAAETSLNSDMALALGFADAVLDRDAQPAPAATQFQTPQNKRDLEAQLRGLGFAKAAASKLAAGGWPALDKAETSPGVLDLNLIAQRIDAHSASLPKHI